MLPLEVIARRAAMSTRTLSRRFCEQVGATPAAWLAHARVRCAQRLLETTELPIERVAADAGSAALMREHFVSVVGTTPCCTGGHSPEWAAPRRCDLQGQRPVGAGVSPPDVAARGRSFSDGM